MRETNGKTNYLNIYFNIMTQDISSFAFARSSSRRPDYVLDHACPCFCQSVCEQLISGTNGQIETFFHILYIYTYNIHIYSYSLEAKK